MNGDPVVVAQRDLRRGVRWVSAQMGAAFTPEALLVVAWEIEQLARSARRAAIKALASNGWSPDEIGDLPGLWLNGDDVEEEIYAGRR